MGQYWRIVNIDRREMLENKYGLKFFEILGSETPSQLVDLLNVPLLPPLNPASDADIEKFYSTQSESRLIGLPRELLDEIVAYVAAESGGADVTCLALTCQYLWSIMERHIRQMFLADAAPWAGYRLITVGDYAGSAPAGCRPSSPSTPSTWLSKSTRHRRRRSEYDDDTEENWLYGWATEFSRPPRALVEVLAKRLTKSTMPADTQLFKRLMGDGQQYHEKGSAPTTMVLRNLTAKEYVREDKLMASKYAYSLGDVVCVHTQWTADPSGIGGLDLEGEWVCHRFDITSEIYVDDSWKDVSEQTIKYLKLAIDELPYDYGKPARPQYSITP